MLGLNVMSKKNIRKSKKLNKKNSKGKSKSKHIKRKIMFIGESGFTNPFGYEDTDPYLFLGNKTVISIFDVLVQYGTNNPARIGWLLDLLPKDQLTSGRIFFIQRQKGMEKSTQNDIIEKKLHSNITTTANTTTPSAKQNAQNASRIGDMRLAEALAGQEDTIVDSDVQLVVKAKTPEDIENVIVELKSAYKNYDVKGIMFVRRTGHQLDIMENMFDDVSADAWHNADMSTVSAGRLFLPSSGFSDKRGVFVGNDMRSLLANNPAIIDYSGVKNAVVFMGDVAPYISVGGFEGGSLYINGGSAVANVIAESNYLNGQRTHHIVLSEFNYRMKDSRYFDMSKETINPFEVFGTPETVQQDANANFDKATTMMMMLSKTKDKIMATNLKAMLIDWFIHRAGGSSGLYTDNPESNPLRAQRILATDNHDTYPKPTDFLSELNTNVSASSLKGERAQESADYLYKAMKTTFNTYNNIFGRATSIPNVFKANDRNIYYDLSHASEDKTVLGALFLNLLAYVTHRALEGEVIVIHGLDQINIEEEPLLAYKERIIRKNIGLITVFEHSENPINPKTFGRFTGRLSRQDAVVLGGLTEEELDYINESWRQPLPQPVSTQLLASENGVLYFYRKRDRVGALVDTHLVL